MDYIFLMKQLNLITEQNFDSHPQIFFFNLYIFYLHRHTHKHSNVVWLGKQARCMSLWWASTVKVIGFISSSRVHNDGWKVQYGFMLHHSVLLTLVFVFWSTLFDLIGWWFFLKAVEVNPIRMSSGLEAETPLISSFNFLSLSNVSLQLMSFGSDCPSPKTALSRKHKSKFMVLELSLILQNLCCEVSHL